MLFKADGNPLEGLFLNINKEIKQSLRYGVLRQSIGARVINLSLNSYLKISVIGDCFS
jgi:hypothetical protein